MTAEEWQEFIAKFNENGLKEMFKGLSDHCSSNVQCGPTACCVKPTIQGKRAITDGQNIHFGRLLNIIIFIY